MGYDYDKYKEHTADSDSVQRAIWHRNTEKNFADKYDKISNKVTINGRVFDSTAKAANYIGCHPSTLAKHLRLGREELKGAKIAYYKTGERC